jgi:hypothetical protein
MTPAPSSVGIGKGDIEYGFEAIRFGFQAEPLNPAVTATFGFVSELGAVMLKS